MDEIHIHPPTRGNSRLNNTRRTSLILRRDRTRNFSLSSEPGVLCAQHQRLISRALWTQMGCKLSIRVSSLLHGETRDRGIELALFPFWLELEICDMLNSKHLFMLKFKFCQFTIHYVLQRCISLLNKLMLQTKLKVFENS
jgi:hypothetical protein